MDFLAGSLEDHLADHLVHLEDHHHLDHPERLEDHHHLDRPERLEDRQLADHLDHRPEDHPEVRHHLDPEEWAIHHLLPHN